MPDGSTEGSLDDEHVAVIVEAVDAAGRGGADQEVRDTVAVRVEHLEGVAKPGVGVGVVADLGTTIRRT